MHTLPLLLLLSQTQALTLGDKAGIPRETFLSFVDLFYPAKPIQVAALGRRRATNALTA